MFGRVLNTPLLLFSRTIFPEEYQESSISSNKYINHTYDKEKQFYIVIKLEQKNERKNRAFYQCCTTHKNGGVGEGGFLCPVFGVVK